MDDLVQELTAVSRPFAEARPLSRRWFVEPGLFELERRGLLRHAWIPVAHEADLLRPGDWVRAPLAGEHLVVVRAADLELRALHAVCLHRGTLLLEGDRGHLPELEIACPYHGWTYATDGEVARAPGAPRTYLVTRPRLDGAELATIGGVVFIRLEPEKDSAPARPPWLERAKLGAIARARRTEHEVATNWKLLVANFQESHHFPHVHPSLEARTPWRSSKSVTSGDGWLGGEMEFAEGVETVSESGTRAGRPFVAAPEDRGRVLDACIFPLWLTSLQPDYWLTYRLAPLAVDRTLVVAEIHVHASALTNRLALEDIFTFWDRTNAEDRAICERQQRGLASERARANVYAESEDGLHAFEAAYARALTPLFGGDAT